MKFRRFNDRGVEQFRHHLHAIKADPTRQLPADLLTDPTLTEPLKHPVEAEPVEFENRMAFARWLHDASGEGTKIPRADAGFWAWLTAALFDQVCPATGRGGRRKVGADARYIPETGNFRRHYRHLLSNPFDILLLHREEPQRALVVLAAPLHQPGELVEQISARRDIVACEGTMRLASLLFIDPLSATRRRGASGTAARRLFKLMNQYHRTWDIPAVDTDAFAAGLPRGFHRFLKNRTTASAAGAEP